MFIPLHAHPLFYGVWGAMSLIVLHVYAGPLLTAYSTIIAFGIGLIVSDRPQLRLVVWMLVLGGLIGWGRFALASYWYSQATQQLMTELQAKKVEKLTGVVTGFEHRYDPRYPYIVTLSIKSVNDKNLGWLKNHTIQCYRGAYQPLCIGDVICVQNLALSLSKKPFHENWSARDHGIATSFGSYMEYERVHRPEYCWQRWLHQQRYAVWKKIRQSLPPKSYTLMASLFGGSKDINKDHMLAIKQSFKRWGLSHQLARSGLHVAFFIALWQALLRLLPLPLMFRSLLIILLLIFYASMSWISLSFMRAVLMSIMANTLRIFGQQVNSLYILTFVTAATLLYNPLHLFFIDFQLSFGFSFILLWLAQLNYLEKRI